MSVQRYLDAATQQLRAADIASARLDALILLEDITGQDRSRLLAHPELELSKAQLRQLEARLRRRLQHEPLAYIRGNAPFFGREFIVNKHVLIPRPESEEIIAILLGLELPHHPRIADIGTGSGCLGITAALERPNAQVYLYDISPHALHVAASNVAAHRCSVEFGEQDLLTNCGVAFDVILANLPYVPETQALNPDATYEPGMAIFSGDDGLNHYRRFWPQLEQLTAKPGYIITESQSEQHLAVRQLAEAHGYECRQTKGLIQLYGLYHSSGAALNVTSSTLV